jgi:hypothetical protein
VNTFYTVAYRCGNNWKLASYPWCNDPSGAENLMEFLNKHVPDKEYRIATIMLTSQRRS